MPICGLSNQWKTREGLLDGFARGEAEEKYGKIRKLLEALDLRSGPTIYVGTSHSLMNFSNRDVIRDSDRTDPFAYVDVVESFPHGTGFCYRVETRRVEGIRPTTEWQRQYLADVEAVVDILIDAFAYADIPPRCVR